MKTTTNTTAIVSRVLLALGASALFSSCSMPPRQAWSMIQRDGLFNYWANSSAYQPSPPLQRSSGQSLAYRPSYVPYSQPRVSYAPPSRSSSSLVTNRYYGPSTSPAPAPQIAQPTYRPKTSSSPRRSTKPRVVRVDDEPASSPNIVEVAPKKSPPPAPSKPSGSSSSSSSSAPKKELPYGSVVAGRPNMVNSPYASKTQLVDVAGMGAGQTVKCPYSGKLFRVPPTQQAANKVESKLDSPNLSSPSKSTSKTEDKAKSEPKKSEAPKSEPKTSEAPKSEPKSEPKAESKPEEKKP